MTKKRIFTTSFYLLLAVSGSLSALDGKLVSIGGSAAWDGAEYQGLTELKGLRPWPVLALASGTASASSLDLALSFDEGKPELFTDRTGRYQVKSGGDSTISSAGSPWARMGKEAVLFSASSAGLRAERWALPDSTGPLTIEPRRGDALFAPGRNMGDFSLEFWVYPLNMENGEQLLSWSAISGPGGIPASPPGPEGYAGLISQRIQCGVAKNRFRWTFEDFFFSPNAGESLNLTLNGQSPIVPKTWSHHLIRFNADTGFLEYLVNGNSEDIVYAASSGREGGEVYTPLVGEGGNFTLGRRFSGMIDEFYIHAAFNAEPDLRRYPASGGRMESRAIDLGENSSRILSLEASGGSISLKDGKTHNEYGGKGDFRFAGDSAIQFFLRAADNPYRWTDGDWQMVIPGAELPDTLKGRYVQAAAVLYPSGDGEISPYLEEIRLLYQPNLPPRPPSQLMAAASDGTVTLSWKSSPDGAAGYLVYYGTAKGEYFGDGATLGASPLDAGKRGGLRIEGLQNGKVYYFAVAAYSLNSPPGASSPEKPERQVGEFSRELSARPLRD
jgi:hypothetical protein